jgi:hypothetical protein
MGRDALRAVTSADIAALLPGGGGAGTRVFTAVCVAPGGDRFYLGDDDGDIIACRVVRGTDADGVMTASVRVDAVANIADDDILNHAPFEDSDDEDSCAGSCAQLSPRVMRLEYMASLNCVVAMTPRRGLTVHHLGLIDPHGRAPIERMRSGRISGTSGAVAFALDASNTHPTCVAVSRAGRKKTSEKHPILRRHRRTSGNRTHDAPDASNRAPSQFPPWSQASRPRAWASRTRRCDSRGTARNTHYTSARIDGSAP